MCEQRLVAASGILAALCVLGGCKGSKSGSEQQPAKASPPSALRVFVDDREVATLKAKEVEAWPRLDTVVPVAARRLGRWATVRLVGRSMTEVQAPSTTHPDLVPAVFPGEGGEPAFGMFDLVELANRGEPKVRHDHLREVRITLATDSGRGEHEQGEGGGGDPTLIRLTVKTHSATTIIEGAKLLQIPRENVPGTDEQKGWTLRTILKAAGITAFEKLVLTDARGTALNIDKTAFDETASIPYVKLNRQGQLRLRIFQKQGMNWNPTGGDLREFVAIEVVK